MGLKEFFTIKMVYFRPYSQYSNIPFFHSDGIDRLPLIILYFQEVVEFPRRLIKPLLISFFITLSCNFGLKAFILLLSRDGCTRLVNNIMITLRSRSIQKDVPVKPR